MKNKLQQKKTERLMASLSAYPGDPVAHERTTATCAHVRLSGQSLRRFRVAELGLSSDELAAIIGLSTNHFRDMEAGRLPITRERWEQVVALKGKRALYSVAERAIAKRELTEKQKRERMASSDANRA